MIFYEFEIITLIYKFLDHYSQNYFRLITKLHYNVLKKPHNWLISGDYLTQHQPIKKFTILREPMSGKCLKFGIFVGECYDDDNIICIAFVSFINNGKMYYSTGIRRDAQYLSIEFSTSFGQCCCVIITHENDKLVQTIVDFTKFNHIKTLKMNFKYSPSIEILKQGHLPILVYDKWFFNLFAVDFRSLKFDHKIFCSNGDRLYLFQQKPIGFKLFRWKDNYLSLLYEESKTEGFILNENSILLFGDNNFRVWFINSRTQTLNMNTNSKIRCLHKVSLNEIAIETVDNQNVLVKINPETKDVSVFDFAFQLKYDIQYLKEEQCFGCFEGNSNKCFVHFYLLNH